MSDEKITYDNAGMAFLEGPRVVANIDEWHQLIANKGYAKCSCGVEFQWQPEHYLPQFQDHRQERLIAAVAAAVRAENESTRAGLAAVLELCDEWDRSGTVFDRSRAVIVRRVVRASP